MSTESTLKSWIEEEEELLQAMEHGRRAGTITRDMVGKMSGIEVMQAVRRGDLPNGPMARTLNYLIIEIEPGRAVVQGHPTENVLNVQCTEAGSRPSWTPRSGMPSIPCCRPERATERWT